jgi:hypothetical protein
VVINFVGPLPKDDGFDSIVTMTDRLNADIQLAPCKANMTAEEFATIFFDKWFCENGCPLELITDRDKLFMSRFWKAVMKLSGINHKMSTAYHPQTDGASEHSNKTVVQALRFHVERNQTGWVKALPKVCFDIMNTVNASTGFTPFMLKSAHSPCLIPPLVSPENIEEMSSETPAATTTTLTPTSDGEETAQAVVKQVMDALLNVKDSLTTAKISQAHHANKDHSPDPTFKVGDRVLLATTHCRCEYMQAKDGWVAKFMPRFDGPFEITHAYPASSTYTLLLPESTKIHRTFHSSLLRPFIENDPVLFPAHTLECPGPIVTAEGEVEYFIDRIIDQCMRGHGKQFLVRWLGYGPDQDLWLPQREVVETEAYVNWIKAKH